MFDDVEEGECSTTWWLLLGIYFLVVPNILLMATRNPAFPVDGSLPHHLQGFHTCQRIRYPGMVIHLKASWDFWSLTVVYISLYNSGNKPLQVFFVNKVGLSLGRWKKHIMTI